MDKKEIEKEAIRVANEILKNAKYDISFNDLVKKLLKKKYQKEEIAITFYITKYLSNYVEILSINPFTYDFS